MIAGPAREVTEEDIKLRVLGCYNSKTLIIFT